VEHNSKEKVLSFVILLRKCTRALTFENDCGAQLKRQKAAAAEEEKKAKADKAAAAKAEKDAAAVTTLLN
jgi:hypothetical protein